jgi:hypothetical protein
LLCPLHILLKVFPKEGTLVIRAHLQTDNATCGPIPSAVTSYFGGGIPRLTAEVLLPWSALGVEGLPPDSYTWSSQRRHSTAPVGCPGVGCRQKRHLIRPAGGLYV